MFKKWITKTNECHIYKIKKKIENKRSINQAKLKLKVGAEIRRPQEKQQNNARLNIVIF